MTITKYTVEACTAPLPSRPPALSEREQKLYDKVLAHFQGAYRLPPGAEDGKGEETDISDDEKRWLSRECLLRYLRATKWDADASITRLESTLRWRRSYGPTSLPMTPELAERIKHEGETGKLVIYGYDTSNRPSIYLLPSRQNTDVPAYQLQYFVWNLERAIDLMEQGTENVTLLIDFSDKAKQPSIGTARSLLSILQDHYPERLGKAYLINIPYFVSLFLKLVMPFVDPVTRSKILINPQVVSENLYTPDQITTKWGGEVEFPYEHERYWTALEEMTERRRESERGRWREMGGGGGVGVSEWGMKGGLRNAAGVRSPSLETMEGGASVNAAGEKADAAAEKPLTISEAKVEDTILDVAA